MKRFNNDVIETERLLLKPLTNDDFACLYDMYQNKDVMKYIYDGELFSEQKTRDCLNTFIQHWHDHGFGFWVVQLQQTNELIGYVGFRYFEDDREQLEHKIELGYMFDKPYWGRGYAKESIRACVEVGMKHYHFTEILATILPANIPSIRVVLSAGFEYAFDADFSGLMHHVYYLKTTE